MRIEEGKLYFIKDEYFKLFKNNNLMKNKENGNSRPCYLCFKDEENPIIIWFVPISHNVLKYQTIYNEKIKKNKRVLNFVFGSVLGKEKVFLIQNIFPVTKKYIKCKYKNKNQDVEINFELKNKVISYAKKVVKITKIKGNILTFNDIMLMKEKLLLEEKISV